MKTIGYDEQVGHVQDLLVKVLKSMMRSGEITLINAVGTSTPRNVPKSTWLFGGGIEIPCIYQIYAYKKEEEGKY